MLEHEGDMNGVENKFEELDPDFEKDLCDLWDMSVQKDVVLVLDEFNAIQIFEGLILINFDNPNTSLNLFL